MRNKAFASLSSGAVFLVVTFLLLSNYRMMLNDSDTAWHMAAGDLIRSLGHIPKSDVFSFTARDGVWVNLAWAWDVAISYLHAHLGWHGPIAFHAIVAALAMTCVYRAALLRSGSGFASFAVVMLAVISLPLHLRSLWVSNLFLCALFLLALFVRYRAWNPRWWYVMPALIPFWVNMHGGFLVAFFLLGAFGLQALVEKQHRLFFHLVAVGVLSVLALGLNPFGYAGVIKVTTEIYTSPGTPYHSEFQPPRFAWGMLITYLYVPLFLFFAIRGKLPKALAENILAFSFLLLGVTSERYLTFFILFSAPLFAQYMATALANTQPGEANPAFKRLVARVDHFLFDLHPRAVVNLSLLACVLCAGLLLTPLAARHSSISTFRPYAVFEPALAYIRAHHPQARFINDYEIGSALIYASGGTVPVFMDGRCETAYPMKVVADYFDMAEQKPGWDHLIDTYGVNGAIATNFREGPSLITQLFANRPGWKKVYSDAQLIVYVRQ